MSFAPQQNWPAYRALTAEADRRHARSLSIEQRFSLYEDLFTIVCRKGNPSPDNERVEQRRWAEKMALRRRLNEIYKAADQRTCG